MSCRRPLPPVWREKSAAAAKPRHRCSAPASVRCWISSPRVSASPRSLRSSTWRRPRSRPTCNGCTKNSASVIEPLPSRRRCAGGCSNSMDRSVARLIDFVAAEPVRLSAFLRLPLIGLIILLVSVWEVEHWLPLAYAVILVLYIVAALVWVVVVLRGPVPGWAGWASTGIDVLTVVALCVVSDGATVALLPVFFLLPILMAFQDRPALAAVVGICTAVGYLGVWIVYSKRDDTVELPSVVYTHFGLLLWLAAAMTALCYFLTRAAARVAGLLEMRRTLVAEAMRADERHARALAEQLHDGPLQDLLAARLELDEVRERHSDPALDAAYQAVQDTAIRLRSH